jgi:hypothetical protein
MSAVAAQLKHDILELQHQHDRLARLVEAKHQELDEIDGEIRRENDRLEKIRSEIKRIKQHFGVQP